MDKISKQLFIAIHCINLVIGQPLELAVFATLDFALAAVVATHHFHVTILIAIFVWY